MSNVATMLYGFFLEGDEAPWDKAEDINEWFDSRSKGLEFRIVPESLLYKKEGSKDEFSVARFLCIADSIHYEREGPLPFRPPTPEIEAKWAANLRMFAVRAKMTHPSTVVLDARLGEPVIEPYRIRWWIIASNL